MVTNGPEINSSNVEPSKTVSRIKPASDEEE
jgi:hypothetical protein